MSWRTIRWNLLACLLLLLNACERGVPSQLPQTETPVTENQAVQATLKGIDVSHFSGPVDWEQVAQSGIHFAFSKATEGNDYVDPMFLANWQEKKAQNIVRGAYHFFIVDDDPHLQAQNFINTVTLEPGDLPPVVDIEKAGSLKGEPLAEQLRIWLNLVETHYGVRPMIYTGNNFWNENLVGDFSQYHLWIAEFETETASIPNGFSQWKFWQFQSDAPIDGVDKGADLNHFNGGHEELKAILIK